MNITITAREVINSKFIETFKMIHGYLTEAEGDEEVDQTYTANAVSSRLRDIEKALKSDISNLSEEITSITLIQST